MRQAYPLRVVGASAGAEALRVLVRDLPDQGADRRASPCHVGHDDKAGRRTLSYGIGHFDDAGREAQGGES
jgi:hypothetical protein